MFTRRTDLQLDRDTLGQFLPWLIAFMVYFRRFWLLAGMLVLDDIVRRWDKGMSGTLTVQIAPLLENSSKIGATQSISKKETKKLEAIVNLLSTTPGVTNVRTLSEDRVLVLLEPWLGKGALAANLPLPTLIDVELEKGAVLDMTALEFRLSAIAPGRRH